MSDKPLGWVTAGPLGERAFDVHLADREFGVAVPTRYRWLVPTIPEAVTAFPRPLGAYPNVAGQSVVQVLLSRVAAEPFNAIATSIFILAVLHTFIAPRCAAVALRLQHGHRERDVAAGRPETPSVLAEFLHFMGEIEVVFGLWALVLLVAMSAYMGSETARHYLNDTVTYAEALFVVVIMSLASTRPITGFAESASRRVADIGASTPAAWWLTILTIGPILGSLITEPAAMTIDRMRDNVFRRWSSQTRRFQAPLERREVLAIGRAHRSSEKRREPFGESLGRASITERHARRAV